MAIDPKWISTPVGAAIGWALTRKIVGPDVSTGQQVVGAGLGGAGGYAVGDMINSADDNDIPDGAQAAQDKHKQLILGRSGYEDATKKRLELFGKHKNIALGPGGGSGLVGGDGKDFLLRTAQGAYSQLYNAKHVADTLEEHMSKGLGSPSDRERWMNTITQARARQKHHKSRLGKGGFGDLSRMYFGY